MREVALSLAVPMHDGDQALEARRRSWLPHPAWLLAGAVVLSAIAACGFYFYPHYRTRVLIAEIERMGGAAHTQSHQPRWVREYLGSDLWPSMVSLESVDLRAADSKDDLAARLGREKELKVVILGGDELSETGLSELCRAPQLRQIILVDCPLISPGFVAKTRAARPSLELSIRGPAMLGIHGVDDTGGCRLTHVEAPAASAGLLSGDILTHFDGQAVLGFNALSDLISVHKPGETVEVKFTRGAEQRQVRVELQAWRWAASHRGGRK